MPIFTRCYDAGIQDKFEKCLAEGRFDEALAALGRLPVTQNPDAFPENEQFQVVRRNFDGWVTRAEGYRALAEALVRKTSGPLAEIM